MKISIKGAAFTLGIVWSTIVFWCIFVDLVGIGSTPFSFVDQLYFGFLSASFFGLIYGTLFGFVDGLIGGAISAVIYNRFAGSRE